MDSVHTYMLWQTVDFVDDEHYHALILHSHLEDFWEDSSFEVSDVLWDWRIGTYNNFEDDISEVDSLLDEVHYASVVKIANEVCHYFNIFLMLLLGN